MVKIDGRLLVRDGLEILAVVNSLKSDMMRID